MVIISPVMGQATSRERIVAAAAEVFAESGYEGAALADIARRAGFTTGAIYGYFRGKAELLLEAVRTALRAQQDAALQATQVGIGDGRLRFEAIAAHFLGAESAASRALVLEAHVAARRDPTVARMLREFQQERMQALTELIEAAQAAGEVRPGVDATATAALFMAVPLGLVLLDAAGLDLPDAAQWGEVAQPTSALLRPKAARARARRRAAG